MGYYERAVDIYSKYPEDFKGTIGILNSIYLYLRSISEDEIKWNEGKVFGQRMVQICINTIKENADRVYNPEQAIMFLKALAEGMNLRKSDIRE